MKSFMNIFSPSDSVSKPKCIYVGNVDAKKQQFYDCTRLPEDNKKEEELDDDNDDDDDDDDWDLEDVVGGRKLRVESNME